jgi:transposase
MKEFDAFVGLDVHKDHISIAVADAERGSEVRSLGSISNTADAVSRLVRKLADHHGRVEFVQEAGPAMAFTDICSSLDKQAMWFTFADTEAIW